jgi:hypothetical protein
MDNRERLLIKSSNNITNLLTIMRLHEENITHYNRSQELDINVFTLSLPMFNSSSFLNSSMFNASSVFDVSSIQHLITDTSYCDITNPLNTQCPITHDTFLPTDQVIMINSCRHIFKKTSLVRWLIRNQTCPCCRTQIN